MYALLACANPCLAGTIAHPTPRDPLLDGGPTTACAQSPNYTPGQDATGAPVVPADVAAGPVPVPDHIAVPLHAQAGRGTGGAVPYIDLDGKKLQPLLNPPPCR